MARRYGNRYLSQRNRWLEVSLNVTRGLFYSSYGVIELPFAINALKEQIAAGALMWVFGSLVFLVPAIY
jgi:putative membrane protein